MRDLYVLLVEVSHPLSTLGLRSEFLNVCLHMKITRTERDFWYDTRIDAYMQAHEHVRVFLIQCMAMSAYIHPHTSVYPYHCLTSLLLCARAQAVYIVHLATMQTAFCVILLRSTYCGSCRQTLAESLQTLQSPMLRGVRRRGGGS